MKENEFAKAPFPWFGGKSRASDLIWSRIGADIGNYIEPFLGSCALWLNRPESFSGWSTVNDLDANIVNFWRSIKYAPELTAKSASNPVFEADLHARHLALVNGSKRLGERLMADPYYHEPELAGWWAWGACVWIGGGWCRGDGCWSAQLDDEGVKTFTQSKNEAGVNRQLPHLGGGRGVNRQLPHLGDGGTGVNQERLEWITEWFDYLANQLQPLRVACGDWSRIMSVGTMTRNGIAGVVLDPPYSQTEAVYANDSNTVAHDVRKWCIENCNNPMLRIALCGHDTEHNELEALGWTVETWNKAGGYQGKDDRERIWFSPHCLKNEPQQLSLL